MVCLMLTAASIVAMPAAMAQNEMAQYGPAQTETPQNEAARDTTSQDDASDAVEPATKSAEAVAPEPPLAEPWVLAILVAVQDHPSLRAADASVRAAELQLQSARQPIEVQLDASYTRLVIEGENPGLIEQPSPHVGVQAVAHPFLYGDLADLEAQREAELARARLTLREATAQLEAQALDAAANVIMARAGFALAEQGVDLAQAALEATIERERRGAALTADVARARQDVARADVDVARAVDRLALARRSLASLTGDSAPALDDVTLPTVGVADGVTPAVARAEVDVALARVGLGAAQRNLYPVAQASYTWNLADDAGSVSVGLESRTLSPSVTYRTSSPNAADSASAAPGTTAAFADLPPMQQMPAPPQEPPRVAGSLTIGASVTLSPERFLAVDAARARLEAAEAALESARMQAELTRASLWSAIEASSARTDVARAEVALAEADVADIARRVDLGLATSLELRQAELAAEQAALSLLQARRDLLQAQLDTFTNAAIPPSEVLE